jgi:Txe/YoeB family toxin of toxin-antitoxin system
VSWNLVYTKKARHDAKKLNAAGLRPKAEELLNILQEDPFKRPPPYEKLVGDLEGAYSRRINIQHRLVYEIIKEKRKVKIIRMWSHYE